MYKFGLLILVVSILSVVFGRPDLWDETKLDWEGRIVGGKNASEGQFPYQVSIRNERNFHFCGGFILSEYWVGTAAHCASGQTPESVFIFYGVLGRTEEGPSSAVEKVIYNPNYDAYMIQNDVALIKTKDKIIFSDMVQPIKLGMTEIKEGVEVIASGWGQTSHPGQAAENLQWIVKRTISNSECRSKLSLNQASRIFKSTLCTDSGEDEGMCMGDSGGPLVFGDEVVGIVSWGIPCAQNRPDMFARVSSFTDWFTKTMEDN